MTRHLSREEFYFLHEALVKKCDEILIKKHGQGLNRTNAQLFYGYQDGSDELNSINFVLTETLKKRGDNLGAFRNFSINGRRLHNNVRHFNERPQEIPMKNSYFQAYLSFLQVKSPKQLIPANYSLSAEIDFSRIPLISKSTTFKPSNFFRFVVIVAFFFLSIFLIRRCSFIDPCNEFGNTIGSIESLKDDHVVENERIKCIGFICNLLPRQIGVLIIERENSRGKKVYWYKDHPPIKEGKWSVIIQEQPNPNVKEYSDSFSIILAAVDSIDYKEKMKEWIYRSTRDSLDQEKPADFKPFYSIIGEQLDRKENLKRNKK